MEVRMLAEARFNEIYIQVLNLLLARSDSTLKWILRMKSGERVT